MSKSNCMPKSLPFANDTTLGDITSSLLPKLDYKHNFKIAIEKLTLHEKNMASIDLSKHVKLSNSKQRHLYFKNINKVKRNWSEKNHANFSTRIA